MSALIAGSAAGMLMASVFVSAGVVMLFAMLKDRGPGSQLILGRFPAGSLTLTLTLLAYPVWGIIGAVMGLLYLISVEQAPGPGIGSPNLVFTLAVVVVAVMMATPFILLLRRVVAGVLVMALAFMGLFGWFLPHFATT